MYLFKEKRFLAVFLVMVRFMSLFSQEPGIITDTTQLKNEVVTTDTITLLKISPDAIDQQVTYKAAGSKKNDLVNKKVTLVRSAVINYGDILIQADSIIFNMVNNQIFAVGVKDTTGNIIGKPHFKSGSEEFDADTLRYNFKSGKAIVKNIITQQQEGLLHSEVTKLLEDGTSNIYKSTYSTCDADTPHFYIALKKAKVYPGDKIISGPGNLVLEGVPLPLYLPFGFFPIQTKPAASGILIPKPHYEEGRGYALTDGGYYFAINDYFDLTLRGNIYTNGSWLINAQSSFNKLYKYSGSFSFSYAKNSTGHKGLSDYNEERNYSIGWTYSQNPKAKPGSRIAASVNMSSSGFDRNNSYNLNEHITTQRQSSISYSKTWAGTPFNLSASMNQSQNVKNKTVNLNLPKVSFNASRIYPLKGKSGGTTKWWQELQFQYSASLDNQINTNDTLLFTNQVWNDMRNGFTHEAPLSLQLRPFKNFTISPQVSYKGVLYTQKYAWGWDPDMQRAVVYDTLQGAFYGHAINPSISAGYSPQIFGTFDFINPDSRIDAIRHVMKPSVSFSFVPSFDGLSSKMYQEVKDPSGKFTEHSIFDGNIYGTPSLSRKSGNVSFNLTNILEAKVFERGDTTGKSKNVRLIDNFGISTSYNIFADSMHWSPVSMVMRTTLFDKIGISANGSLSMYGVNSKGNSIDTYYFTQVHKLLRLTSFSAGLDFSLSDLLKRKDDKKKSSAPAGANPQGTQRPGIGGAPSGALNTFGYAEFNVPWTMNVRYSFNYSKYVLKPTISQTLSVNGNVKLTSKMAITYSSGYDFDEKKITMTQIGVTRDLHCWNMAFSWVPNGSMKMWTFSINVKASVLADLKYERRKDYHDNY
ncbi:MAG: putative LPS assembly protein LptD [Bacteroidia bacterium]|nr:putative LPS assembly protein LptD [Bacteroidia bacterium]